jgi:transposase InsO family protein
MDIRDNVVNYVRTMSQKSGIAVATLVGWAGITVSKYYTWVHRFGVVNRHNGKLVREYWLLWWEYLRIIAYRRTHREEGYRRLTYMMLDENIVAVSPSTTYRILKNAGLLNGWNRKGKSPKGSGFQQPTRVHEHWHTDIKYVNFRGTFLFLISVIDGYSRYIVHHELRVSMEEYDIQLVLERALEKFPGARPRVISDNGGQFIAKDFAEFIRERGLTHVRTSVAYPQSNGKIERLHRTAGEECLRRSSFIDLEDARRLIATFVEYYNSKRLHSAIYFLTPEDVLLGRATERLKEREQKYADARRMRRESADGRARQDLKNLNERAQREPRLSLRKITPEELQRIGQSQTELTG